ncbi:uncharacterized protein A1O9_06831 [Exophiala aquamarina CBS 119918]|uniref:JmjC domain-containing protein n=1 Tax=Exophiala aquamarina CBS 119918 TaxID=1182545 RepID=A0A072PA56_9EURO|nr:uncharacterized protein A1O9_06831 [Exophiala aquamarina CBS 119918]KEF56642.1 hypothetical protein A1O9_06831 [Exophiala aquamarina CBS 119918]
MNHDSAAAVLIQLIEEYHDYNSSGICEFAYPATIDFSKQVSRGRPCVYNVREAKGRQGATSRERTAAGVADNERIEILSSPAFAWTAQSLCAKVQDEVEVAVTPDGRADALYALPRPQTPNTDRHDDNQGEEDVFVQPSAANMTLSTLLDRLMLSSPSKTQDGSNPSTKGPVYYLQSQNSNLTSTPLSPLLDDLPSNLPFAAPVLGEPDAINIWIGDHRSVTSTHRDPYENLYLVVRGSKTFTLYAPVEELCLHAKMVRTGRLVQDESGNGDDSGFRIELDEHVPLSPRESDGSSISQISKPREQEGWLPWIPISPLLSQSYINNAFPYYKYARPETVTVEAGQILYLPSGWFHHVTQQCGSWDDGTSAPCIAVNYWFDMDYGGEKFVMRQAVGKLVEAIRNGEMVQGES